MRFTTNIFGSVIAAIFIAGSAAAGPVSAASADDACSVLTQRQVSAAVGAPVSPGSYVSPNFKKTCSWNATSAGASGVKYVTLLLQGADSFQAGRQLGQVATITVTSVRGLGDDAYYLAVADNVGLIVKKGNVSFKVAVYATTSLERKEVMEKALARQVLSKL